MVPPLLAGPGPDQPTQISHPADVGYATAEAASDGSRLRVLNEEDYCHRGTETVSKPGEYSPGRRICLRAGTHCRRVAESGSGVECREDRAAASRGCA